MLHDGGVVEHIYIWERVGAAMRSEQQTVALRLVAASIGIRSHLYQTSV